MCYSRLLNYKELLGNSLAIWSLKKQNLLRRYLFEESLLGLFSVIISLLILILTLIILSICCFRIIVDYLIV